MKPPRHAVLKEAQVLRIIELRKQGLGPLKISKLIGANYSTVKHIVHGRNWKHLTGGKVPKGPLPSKTKDENE